jgi:hypothetical protein
MAELLDRIHAEIRERMELNRAAVLEYELLEAALAALGPPARVQRRRSAPQPRPSLRALEQPEGEAPQPAAAEPAAPEPEATEPEEIAAAA